MVAMAVTTAPMPLIMARRRQPGGRSRRQCTTRPVWDSVKPMNTPMANSGMSVLVLPSDGDQERGGQEGQDDDPVGEDLAVASQREEVRGIVVAREQAGEDREPAEGRVGRQGEHDRDRDGDDVVGPATADGHRHDLAEDGLPRSGADVPALREHRQAEQHGAEDDAEQHLGPLGPHGPWLAEQRHAVGDRLDAGERAAPGREGLQDEQDGDRLESARGQLRRAELLLVQAEGMDEADGDDGEQAEDEDQRGQQEGTGRLAQAAQVEHRDDEEDAEAERDGGTGKRGEGGGERGHTGRDGDGDGQRVVDHERRRRRPGWCGRRGWPGTRRRRHRHPGRRR